MDPLQSNFDLELRSENRDKVIDSIDDFELVEDQREQCLILLVHGIGTVEEWQL